MSSTHTQNQLCTATPISSLCSVFTFRFSHFLRQRSHLHWAKSGRCYHMSAPEWTDIYVVHLRRTRGSSFRNLAWVAFEPRVAEFYSEALTDWAVWSWSQFTVRAKFVQLLQFHQFVQCWRFISVIAFVSWHICFKRNFAEIMTWV